MQYGEGMHTRGLFLLDSPPLPYNRDNITEQLDIVEKLIGNSKSWSAQELLRAMREQGTDLYFDEVTQVRLASWSNGRIALLGDAAAAPTLITGQGTSLAIVAAYVLAGELAAVNGEDYKTAFHQYEKALRLYVEKNQAIAFAQHEFTVPTTWEEVEAANAALRAQSASDEMDEGDSVIFRLTREAANALDLKSYEAA